MEDQSGEKLGAPDQEEPEEKVQALPTPFQLTRSQYVSIATSALHTTRLSLGA